LPSGPLAGIGLTHLKVYGQRPSPDGKQSGCPHVHAVCDEAYYVISGTGALELHDKAHGFRSVPLYAGRLVQFAPGTLHRAVNADDLTVLCLMSNAGLPERGDARIWFGPEVDADPDAYRALWRLPQEKGLEGALERRDRSVSAYMKLIALWESDRDDYVAELDRFVAVHTKAVQALSERFATTVAEGPGAWLDVTNARIAALPALAGDPDALEVTPAGEEPRFGMCGMLRPLEISTAV